MPLYIAVQQSLKKISSYVCEEYARNNLRCVFTMLQSCGQHIGCSQVKPLQISIQQLQIRIDYSMTILENVQTLELVACRLRNGHFCFSIGCFCKHTKRGNRLGCQAAFSVGQQLSSVYALYCLKLQVQDVILCHMTSEFSRFQNRESHRHFYKPQI